MEVSASSIALAAAIALSPAVGHPQDLRAGADHWPAAVDVFRRHARGSGVPARVERVPMDVYVGRVLQSGAMPPDRPMAALRAMAVVVATRATWLTRHPDRRMRWHGRAFDVTDGSRPAWCGTCDHGQLYRATKVHSRIKRAVSAVHGYLLRRPNGNIRKAAWSGTPAKCGEGVTGNRLPAQGAAMCARRGWSDRRILATYFPKGTVAA